MSDVIAAFFKACRKDMGTVMVVESELTARAMRVECVEPKGHESQCRGMINWSFIGDIGRRL